MSYLIDSHCHIHDCSVYNFALSRQKRQTIADFTPEKILKRMSDNHVKKAICIGTSHGDSLAARDFAAKYNHIYWSYGIHPEEAENNHSQIIPDFQHDTPVAIGEVGLDYHSDHYDRSAQITLLEQMLDLAHKNNLPLIFHVRDAFDDFFAILNNFHNIRGVIHSFSDSQKHLKQSLDRDFYIGINGLATFTKLPLPPLERTLLETDSPFLTPTPFRGHINDPSHVKDIASWLAKKHQIPFNEVATITTHNTESLFNI